MIPLTLLPHDGGSRVKRDRLELLTALLNAPGFDSLYRADIITIPPQHAAYAWCCVIEGCGRIRCTSTTLCFTHVEEWKVAKAAKTSMADFRRAAKPLAPTSGLETEPCRICPGRPALSRSTRLCDRHQDRWDRHSESNPGGQEEFAAWLADEVAFESFGVCRVAVCPYLAASPLGLCFLHRDRYQRAGCPGGAKLPTYWHRRLSPQGLPVPVTYADEALFRNWCVTANPLYRIGVINLVNVPPMAKAEIQWGLYANAQAKDRAAWDLGGVQRLANHARRHRFTSLVELDAEGGDNGLTRKTFDSMTSMICYRIVTGLRCVYYSPQDTKDAGFIETDHFGRRFHDCQSRFELTDVSQRWLRDLTWDFMANTLSSPQCPRSRGPFDNLRRACIELSAFLELDASAGGHDPALLREEHAHRFVADQRHRARHGMNSLGLVHRNGKPGTVTDSTHRFVFNATRKLFYWALESSHAAQLGLDTSFLTAIPTGGTETKRSRNPFPDEAARALADETNLQQFAATYDPNDRGLRDAWEAIVYTGRRCSEVLKLRLDCIGRYRTLPMLWHDQSKVGNYNEGIRIPEVLYTRLDERRHKTLIRFEHRHGRLPTPQERGVIALFPSDVRNPYEDKSICYAFFSHNFRAWVDSLAIGAAVTHQARHTLATNLLRAGASLAHIRRYLGHLSDRMAERYVKITNSDLEDVLHAVWVAGPGAPNPGELLSGDSTPLTREHAMALMLDVSRHSTPADGGFCTFQPVVNGGACPWQLDCENCDKFVLSGADLLYWRRKQEQWRSIAERAPDDATADYLHKVFEPTARAIAGLEKALAGLGILDEALQMDLRRPQDYFHRVWSTNFRATDLAELETTDGSDDITDEEQIA